MARSKNFKGKADHDKNGSVGGARAPLAVGEVVNVFTRNPINGQLQNKGTVLKVASDNRAVVSVTYNEGGTTEFVCTLGAGDQYYTREE